MTSGYDYDDLVDDTRTLLQDNAEAGQVSDEQVADATGVEITTVRAMLDAENGGRLTVERDGDTRTVTGMTPPS